MRNLRALWHTAWLLACLLLLATSARAAEPSLTADFDGDGQRDRVVLDRTEPSVLRVWLSTTGATAVIRSRTPVIRVVATDLDGDHRAELIARGTSTLQVWTSKKRGFRSYRAQPAAPETIAKSRRHALDEGAPAPPGDATTGATTLALTLSARPRAPGISARDVEFSSAPGFTGLVSFAPFAPRPPPVSA
jgi:hypothetical protein